jgi:hypothetical protein
MYNILCEFNNIEDSERWNKAWKLRVLERVRSFVWLMLHERLLTNLRKSNMGLGHAMCRFCGDTVENELHAIRDCPVVMPLWLNTVEESMRSTFFISDWQQWLDLNLNSFGKWSENTTWKDYWATVCHCIRSWLNKEEHYDHFQRPLNAAVVVANHVKQYSQAELLQTVLHKVNKTEVRISWKPPMEEWVKLNTDGAYKEGRVAGCGGVIRDSNGVWKGGFAKNLGICSAYVAELWGVLEGLKHARSLGFKRIELEVDSSVVRQVLLQPGCGRPLGGSLVMCIRRLMELARLGSCD